MDTKTKAEELERDYRERKAEIQANPALSFEKKQLQIKALGDEYHAQRRELERSASTTAAPTVGSPAHGPLQCSP